MKKTYFCSNCHQYHPQSSDRKKITKKQEKIPYLRFADLFGFLPKADPRCVTLSLDNDTEIPFRSQNRKKKANVRTSKTNKTVGRMKTDENQKSIINIESKISMKYRHKTPLAKSSSRCDTPLNQKGQKSQHIKKSITNKATLPTKPTPELNKYHSRINISSYQYQQEGESSVAVHKPYLISNISSSNGQGEGALDYQKKMLELKNLLRRGVGRNKTESQQDEKRKLIISCRKKDECTLHDNRCCGVQVWDEGEMEVQVSKID